MARRGFFTCITQNYWGLLKLTCVNKFYKNSQKIKFDHLKLLFYPAFNIYFSILFSFVFHFFFNLCWSLPSPSFSDFFLSVVVLTLFLHHSRHCFHLPIFSSFLFSFKLHHCQASHHHFMLVFVIFFIYHYLCVSFMTLYWFRYLRFLLWNLIWDMWNYLLDLWITQ